MRRAAARSLVALAAALGLTAGAASARAEEDDPLAGLSGQRALEFAKEIASDAMKGRKTGFEGGRLAETWIQSKLGELGLDPLDAGGTYLFDFEFGANEVVPPISLALDGQAAEYGKDFVDLLYTGAGKAEAEVVFVGYGISAKDRGWDDYDGVDVRGKVVLAIRGAPKERESEFAAERQIGWKSAFAADHGAVGFLLCEGKDALQGTIQEKFFRAPMPAVGLSGALADRLLGKRGRTLEELKAARDAGDPGRSFSTGVAAKLEVNGRFVPKAQGRDGMAGFFGRDPDLRKEAVIVGAHLDHLGTDAMGRVFNGADDNGSGSATLLMLAETLAKNRWKPSRTVVFVWFGAEEQGLVGSRRFAEAMPFQHSSVVAMINIDMTGQGKPEVNLGGGECYPKLYDLAVSGLPEALRKTTHPFRVDPNSDHWPFYERGIPALFAHSAGDHPNYHQVTDDVENLKPECMEAVARVVGTALVKIADAEEPLATGRDAAGLVLREGPRVVEGEASEAALWTVLRTEKDKEADRAPLRREGYATVVVPLSESKGGSAVAWSRLALGAKPRGKDVVLARGAADLANAARGGRTAILARLACAESAAQFPRVLSTYRDMGVRWVEPFSAASLPDEATRAAILEAAVESRLVLDLSGMPADFLAAARAKLGDHPVTYRVTAPLAADPAAAAVALKDLRTALGPKTLVLLSGGAEAPLLTPAALAAADDPALAPVAVVSEKNDALETALAVAPDEQPPYADPASPSRKCLQALFGQSFVDLFRRLP